MLLRHALLRLWPLPRRLLPVPPRLPLLRLPQRWLRHPLPPLPQRKRSLLRGVSCRNRVLLPLLSALRLLRLSAPLHRLHRPCKRRRLHRVRRPAQWSRSLPCRPHLPRQLPQKPVRSRRRHRHSPRLHPRLYLPRLLLLRPACLKSPRSRSRLLPLRLSPPLRPRLLRLLRRVE